MKIYAKVLSILLIIIFCFSGCGEEGDESGAFGFVPSRPDKAELELWILDDVADFDFSDNQVIYGLFGSKGYFGLGYDYEYDEYRYESYPEHFVVYYIIPYPDYADGGSYITRIEITDPNVSVYGLTVNSTWEEFCAIFEPQGYEMKNDGSFSAEKDGISFRISKREWNEKYRDVNTLQIRAKVQNREGAVF